MTKCPGAMITMMNVDGAAELDVPHPQSSAQDSPGDLAICAKDSSLSTPFGSAVTTDRETSRVSPTTELQISNTDLQAILAILATPESRLTGDCIELILDMVACAKDDVVHVPNQSLLSSNHPPSWVQAILRAGLFTHVITCLNINRNHWAMAGFGFEPKVAWLSDSLQAQYAEVSKAQASNVGNRLQAFYPTTAQSVKGQSTCPSDTSKHPETGDWTVCLHTSPQQQDNFSCGVFALIAAVRMICGLVDDNSPEHDQFLVDPRQKIDVSTWRCFFRAWVAGESLRESLDQNLFTPFEDLQPECWLQKPAFEDEASDCPMTRAWNEAFQRLQSLKAQSMDRISKVELALTQVAGIAKASSILGRMYALQVPKLSKKFAKIEAEWKSLRQMHAESLLLRYTGSSNLISELTDRQRDAGQFTRLYKRRCGMTKMAADNLVKVDTAGLLSELEIVLGSLRRGVAGLEAQGSV